MPITINMDRGKNLTVIKITGTVPFDELKASLSDYYKNGVTDFIMVDLREATGGGETYYNDQIFGFAHSIEDLRKDCQKGRTALVAPKDLYFGLCRMFETYRGTSEIQYETFRNMDEALEWLNNESSTNQPDRMRSVNITPFGMGGQYL